MNNKIPCGGFYLSDTLGVDENGKLGVNGGEPYKSLVTDGDGNVKWEDRLAYEVTGWKDFTLNDNVNGIKITGFTIPPVGSTVTVKVNGVESVETVKSGETEGQSYSYIGSTDIAELFSGTEGWSIADVNADVRGMANPETTISLFVTEQHKIDEKYQDENFVRPLSYYIDGIQSLVTYYNESGDNVIAAKCDNIKLPRIGEAIIYDLDREDMGISRTFSTTETNNAFFIRAHLFANNNVHYQRFIYGTDETAIAEFAAENGYTLTTKPTT